MEENFERTTQRISSTPSAQLFYGINKHNGSPVAVKVYKFTTSDPRATIRELSVLRRLEHPNLIRMYNYYESLEETALVTELASEELLQYVVEKRYYCEDDCRGFIQQIL